MFGYQDLTHDERIALVALLRLVVQADRRYTSAEDSRLAQISSEMGDAQYDDAVREAREKLPGPDEVRRNAATVDRAQARSFMLSVLEGIAVVDGEGAEGAAELESLRRLWNP